MYTGRPVKKSLKKQFIQRTICFKPPGKYNKRALYLSIQWLFLFCLVLLSFNNVIELKPCTQWYNHSHVLLIYLRHSLLSSPPFVFFCSLEPLFSRLRFLFTEWLQAKTTEHFLKLLSAVLFAIHQFLSPAGNRHVHLLVTNTKTLPINKSSWLLIV